MRNLVNLILIGLLFLIIILPVYAQEPTPVTPSSVSGRVLPLPLEQSRRRIKLSWDASPSPNVTHYCIYYRKTTSPSTGTDLKYQPCYDYGYDTYGPVFVIDTGNTSTQYTITNLDYNYWYIFQITANPSGADCDACQETDDKSDPSPLESYGVFITRGALKWEEYTE